MTGGNGAGEKSPKTSGEPDHPEPERPLNTQEEKGESLQEMDEPPQAEGDRESAER